MSEGPDPVKRKSAAHRHRATALLPAHGAPPAGPALARPTRGGPARSAPLAPPRGVFLGALRARRTRLSPRSLASYARRRPRALPSSSCVARPSGAREWRGPRRARRTGRGGPPRRLEWAPGDRTTSGARRGVLATPSGSGRRGRRVTLGGTPWSSGRAPPPGAAVTVKEPQTQRSPAPCRRGAPSRHSTRVSATTPRTAPATGRRSRTARGGSSRVPRPCCWSRWACRTRSHAPGASRRRRPW